MSDVSGLYSTIRNLMGVDHPFGYIPPHGRRLLANQSYSVPGDIVTRIALGGGQKGWNQQRFRSLERDLLLGRLAIEKTPQPLFFDGAAKSPIANPTVATTASNSAGSTVWTGPSGNYLIWYTWINGYGETTVGASKIASAVTLTNGTSQLQITVPTLPTGGTGVNIYMSAAGGTLATATFLMTSATGGAKNAPATFPAATALPGSNTAVVPAPILQPAVNPTGGGSSGGALAAGTYFLEYAFTNANGETTVSPESAQFTVAAGNIPSVQLQPAPAGATGYNIYLTAANGGTGTEVLYTSVPTPAGGVPSNIVGYLQPGTAVNAEVPAGLYLLASAAPASAVTPLGASTAVLSPPTMQPVVSVPGVTSTLSPPSNITGYLQPGLYSSVAQQGFAYGGQLQAGTYLLKYTYKTAAGETTPGPESAAFTVTAGQIPLVLLVPSMRQGDTGPGANPPGGQFPAGVTGINIYLTAAGGGSGTETLYLSGVLSGIVKLAATQGAQVPPLANTTFGHSTRSIQVSADTLGTVDPSWGSYEGAA